MKNGSSIVKNTIILVIMTLILGTILGSVHYITEEPIAAQEQKEHDEALEAVMPGCTFETVDLQGEGLADTFAAAIADVGLTAESVDEMNIAADASGAPAGYVFSITTKEGYGGEITFTLGLTEEGTITGISFLSISETAGLGMRADTDAFKGQFADRTSEFLSYTKTGARSEDEIDALSGSTVTTNAIVNGVNAGLVSFKAYKEGGNS
ncbi:MAG TPA: FMN-binding protein [Lachnospiraceae bacterium]|nr:FMN-binding protein [Lachnospiraceae bacterium]